MSETTKKIPFSVEISRMIEVLAAQIYPTPFALLRENVQNAYDAILLRKHAGERFDAKIEVNIEAMRVSVKDNGIGMTEDDLRLHFWRAGSSSKNTENARAAGVVGTFGIGAMANFGIAEGLTVETESRSTEKRTFCSASRSTLSVTEDCISFENRGPTGEPGTTVIALMQTGKPINVTQATEYLRQFVSFLPIEVLINGVKTSGLNIENSVPQLPATWSYEKEAVELGDSLKADIVLAGALNGEMRVVLKRIALGSTVLEGLMVLRQGTGSLKTFRSGFGLATASVASQYAFGGIADLLILQPTAGREALVTESMQLLQRIVTRIDEFVSEKIGRRPESNSNSNFIRWAHGRGRIDLCSFLRVRIEPGEQLALHEVRDRSQHSKMLVYAGSDPATIKHASEERPIIMLSHGSPRRDCELRYLRDYCKIEEVSDQQKVLKEKPQIETTAAEKALAFKIAMILSQDYFLEAQVRFGEISHGLPVLITKTKPEVEIFLDPHGATVRLILELYEKEYVAFGHMVKDFVRNMIFTKISNLVPSATRQGAEAFLKSIHRSREIFEYETTDLESLTSLWEDYLAGRLTFAQATEKSTQVAARSYQIVDRGVSGAVRDVVPDVITNEAATGEANEPVQGPLPPIQRLDISTNKKILTIEENEQPLKGYRCFLAITDRIREQRGDFFLQPHRTSVVWGGQKALFIFEHHSGEFGLYYDLHTQGPITNQSGGGTFETCTIVMKNRIFIPIPPAIQASFLPQNDEKKRFEVRCDVLHIDRQGEELNA